MFLRARGGGREAAAALADKSKYLKVFFFDELRDGDGALFEFFAVLILSNFVEFVY